MSKFELNFFSERAIARPTHHESSDDLPTFLGSFCGLMMSFLGLAPNRRIVVEVRVKDRI